MPSLFASCVKRLVPFLVFLSFCAQASEATLAGFAFAGDFKHAAQRFPYSYKIFERSRAQKASLSAKVVQRSGGVQPAGFSLKPAGQLVNLKNSDQALMVVLLLTDEVVSSEHHGSYYKTFVNLRGDLLIFDYKNQTVVRTYPLSTVLFDATPNAPSAERLEQFVETLLTGSDEQSLIGLFIRWLGPHKPLSRSPTRWRGWRRLCRVSTQAAARGRRRSSM